MMMAEERFPSMRSSGQKGNIVVYILIALFLTGMLVAMMTQGAKKSATTQQLDEIMLYLQTDIKTIQQAFSECAQSYRTAVDVNNDGTINATDNPNPPFPLYCADGTCALTGMTSGGAGTAIANSGCPGAPDGQRVIFNANAGNNFKTLSDTATYTTQYFTDATEGSYIRISRASSDPVWSEAIARLNNKYSKCSAAAVTAAAPCDNGCFYLWTVRLATSTLGGEVGCP